MDTTEKLTKNCFSDNLLFMVYLRYNTNLSIPLDQFMCKIKAEGQALGFQGITELINWARTSIVNNVLPMK